MAEKVVKYDDYGMDFLDYMPMIIIGIFTLAVVFSAAVSPITQYVQAQAYQGKTSPKTVKADGTLRYLDVRHDYPYTPWISAYFINDGPDPVEIAINYPDEKFTINPGGTMTVNRSGALERIAVIFYICGRGKTASVRIIGEY
ncbi:hypothetical protein ES706_05172 [subsurface metagenome]